MPFALIAIASLLGIAAGGSAVGKLRRDPRILESLHGVGVTDQQIPLLAVLELLGVVGLVVGIWVPLVGIAAAIGLTLYFLGAVVAHVRHKEPAKAIAPAALLAVLALITAVLEVAR